MSVKVLDDHKVEYLYKFKKGVSTIKGGIKVLYDLEYPESIITSTKKILDLCN
jgi:DNA mismatch repair ATPase MutS